jgi:hypothetical protein
VEQMPSHRKTIRPFSPGKVAPAVAGTTSAANVVRHTSRSVTLTRSSFGQGGIGDDPP